MTLIYPDFEELFFYHTTDASNIAVGGFLQQKDEYDKLRSLTLFSRELNKAEVNYNTIKKKTCYCLLCTNKQNLFL